MAKKKRNKTRKKQKIDTPQHALPIGFWSQTGAVVLIVFSLLLLVSWFGMGGPVFDWIFDFSIRMIGLAAYAIPFVGIYMAIQVFKGEDNRIPAVMKVASILIIVWLSGLTGLFRSEGGATTGGVIGDSLNSAMMALVNMPVGVIIYILLIVVTGLFMLSLSFADVVGLMKRMFGSAVINEADSNEEVMRKAEAPAGEFKMNAGVPMLNAKERRLAAASRAKESLESDKDVEDKAALVSMIDPNWVQPSLDLLERKQVPADPGDVKNNAEIIKRTLSEFSIDVTMEGANIGPKVTQYTLLPPSGVKLARITQLESNMALNLEARTIRIEAPIPGKRAVGIEVPNKRAADVRLRGMLESREWRTDHEPLSFVVGRDIAGEPIVGELNKMPHLLIAGQTNSGKSVMINTLLCSLLYRNSPARMKLILVDPKQVEMARYKDIPHLLTPIITEPDKTVSALKWAVNEMERRYKLLAEVGELNIEDYNDSLGGTKKKIVVQDEDGNEQEHDERDGAMPYIVVVIDEMADLMMVAPRDVEGLVVRLAQKARAIGIHLVLATQSPRADVITGLIKANVPAKIAFTVGNQVESRIILDQVGAEKLLGRGDMLYKTTTMSKPIRVQGALVENKEVKKIADHLRMQSPPQYDQEIISQPVSLNVRGGSVMDLDGGDNDSLFNDACQVVIDSRKASTTLLQRKLRVGYSRAARIMEEMEEQGIIGPPDGSRPREVLVTSMSDLTGV